MPSMRLRVLTYNVHKCVGGVDRRYDPVRVTDVIGHHEPDVVLLQEVAQGSTKFNGERQIERLGDLLDMRHRAYAVNVRKRGDGGEYGNAILSRFPLTRIENQSLRIPPKKMRSVLHARCRVRFAGGHTRSLHLFNMHLGLSGIERKMQLGRFLASHPFAGLHKRTPILVGGDLNDVWGTLGRLFEPSGFRSRGQPLPTFPAFAPVRMLDGVWVRGDLAIERLERSRLELARRASDHLPLVADLEIRRE